MSTAVNLTHTDSEHPGFERRFIFDTVIEAIVSKCLDSQRRVLQANCKTDDDRLIRLWHRVSNVGDDVANLQFLEESPNQELLWVNLGHDLVCTAACALAWLSPSPELMTAWIERIWKERERQRELFRAGKISFDVANPLPDVRRKYRVLAEEAGEVAHAIDQIENHGMAPGNLHLELIQVAAVCVAWLEALEEAR